MTIRAIASDPLRNFEFVVKFDSPIPTGGKLGTGAQAGFTKVDGISEEAEVIEWRSGDADAYKQKLPGQRNAGNVTFERGIDLLGQLRLWWNLCKSEGTFCRSDIIVTSKSIGIERPTGTVKLKDAWPSGYAAGTLDSSANDVWVETMTVACEEIEYGWAK